MHFCPYCDTGCSTEKGLRSHVVQKPTDTHPPTNADRAAERIAHYKEHPDERPAGPKGTATPEPDGDGSDGQPEQDSAEAFPTETGGFNPARQMPEIATDGGAERCPDCRAKMKPVREGVMIEGTHDGRDVSIASDGNGDHHCTDCELTVLGDGSVVR